MEGHYRLMEAVNFADSHGQNSNISEMYGFTEMNSVKLTINIKRSTTHHCTEIQPFFSLKC